MSKVWCAIALAATLLAGCSADGGGSAGDGAGLPGPLPDGVAFAAPPSSAPQAPEFEFDLLGGQRIAVADQWDERPVVLVFFESWCDLCREQQGELNELVEEYRDVIAFLGVAGISDPDDVRVYIDDEDIAYPVGTDPDGKVWRLYSVAEAPLLAVVSQDGTVIGGWSGTEAVDAVRGALAEIVIVG